MSVKQANRITAVWKELEALMPDKSTEFLLEAVATTIDERGICFNADASTVCEALVVSGEFGKKAGAA